MYVGVYYSFMDERPLKCTCTVCMFQVRFCGFSGGVYYGVDFYRKYDIPSCKVYVHHTLFIFVALQQETGHALLNLKFVCWKGRLKFVSLLTHVQS